ncbi:MAG: hypothetical protein AAGC56_04925 [Pseudomonadota bacterium]
MTIVAMRRTSRPGAYLIATTEKPDGFLAKRRRFAADAYVYRSLEDPMEAQLSPFLKSELVRWRVPGRGDGPAVFAFASPDQFDGAFARALEKFDAMRPALEAAFSAELHTRRERFSSTKPATASLKRLRAHLSIARAKATAARHEAACLETFLRAQIGSARDGEGIAERLPRVARGFQRRTFPAAEPAL